jgi:hypothetical protein
MPEINGAEWVIRPQALVLQFLSIEANLLSSLRTVNGGKSLDIWVSNREVPTLPMRPIIESCRQNFEMVGGVRRKTKIPGVRLSVTCPNCNKIALYKRYELAYKAS